MDKTTRSFLAVHFSPTVISHLGRVQERWRRNLAGAWRIGWVKTANLHLTLQFLGEVEDSRLPDIMAALRLACGGRPSFEITLQGVGAFPSIERPRVLWAGITQGAQELITLARAVQQENQGLGFALEKRPFSPHATLARVRQAVRGALVLSGMDRGPAAEAVSCQIDRVACMTSRLTPTGPIYTELDRAKLGG